VPDVRLPERYVSARLVGRGGMGEIYVAEDTVLGRHVAIKLLDERFARDEQIRARFTREALTAAKLSGHPNIVTIFDVGEYEGRPFIVMEYLSGGTVADRARGGRVEPEEALAWLAQAASALDDAHAAGVVHRDVKPANLLLDERGNVHVADFGIARVADESTAGMTAAGTILGTAGYLSPEQARGDPATSASDVYALGIVAYELLTGGRPFEGTRAREAAGRTPRQGLRAGGRPSTGAAAARGDEDRTAGSESAP
jgi:serine/threonine-protein kinase